MRIISEETVGLVVDLQERLVPHMSGRDELIARNRILLQGFKLLDIPVVSTEQYPKGLGKTVEAIREVLPDTIPFEKITFSCCDDAAIRSRLQSLGRKTVLIAGIEAHVCVLQTAIDLNNYGMSPVVVEDAVASRRENDKRVALGRIAGGGGRITTVESVLFELMCTAQHASFKALSTLVK
ncbi:MAG: isochorismatase family protein [Chitinispirillaceae bacterium]|nr:isochorismatase family protein [Chitinispirillaceae bacterium]